MRLIGKDTVYRQEAVEALKNAEPLVRDFGYYNAIEAIRMLPSAESVKAYTKVDYIIALHKEYGCTLTMAEEAHNKALEYLRSKARMKG